MHTLPLTAAAMSMVCGIAFADEENSFTDKDGAQYTILSERPFTDTLKAQMVEIVVRDLV